MKKAILLAFLCIGLLAMGAGCNGANLNSPTSDPLPGKGTDGQTLWEKTQLNYAIDILPEREPPETIIIDDPTWEPAFDCLIDEPECIDEGCMTIVLKDFDPESRIVSFKCTFFNPNQEAKKTLTVFFYVTDVARGIAPVDPDGYMPIGRFETEVYPYYAFSSANNTDHETPGSMYVYFEREISFTLEEGADFFVEYTLIAMEDTQNLSYLIDIPDPIHEENENGNEDEGGGSDGRTNHNGDVNGSEVGGTSIKAPGVRGPEEQITADI